MKKNRMLWTWLVLFALTAPIAIGASVALAETHGTMMPDGSFIADQPVSTATITSSTLSHADPAPAVPDNSPWWMKLLAPFIATLATTLVAGLTAILAWVTNNIKTFFAQKASEANTKESAAWYKTALFAAGMAVRYAESKFGPDTAKGQEKQKEAAGWLKERLVAIDPSIKTKMAAGEFDKLVDGLVGAAYHDAFEAVSPLGGSQAPKPQPAPGS